MNSDDDRKPELPPTPGTGLMSKTSKKAFRHAKALDPDCVICIHAHREEIESVYVGCEDVNLIAEASGTEPKDIERHMKALGKFEERADNTDGIARRGLSAAMDAGTFDKLDADQAIKLLQERNKMLGKTREKDAGNGRPQIIALIGIPFVPASDRDAHEDPELVEGKVVAALPAGLDEDDVAEAPVSLFGGKKDG